MQIDGVSSQLNSLYHTFQGYLSLGWSIIPVRQKIAAVPWAAYQYESPSLEQLRTWFADPTITGAAVITGAVSGIMVLDFDNIDLFRAFCRQQPQLTNTLTVRTRRGFHLYFTIPQTLQHSIKSQRGQGIDLLYTGRYAILPGSQVDGHIYSIQQAASIHQLSPSDLKRIQGFMSQHGRVTPESSQNAVNRSTEPFTGIPESQQQPSTSLDTLRYVYLSLAGSGQGRNNALFFCACLGRDHGLSCAEVTTALAQLHRSQLAPAGHRRETSRARHLEAVRTIASAFTRPARPQAVKPDIPTGLPNSVRERLLEQGRCGVIRVIEGLRWQGIQVGQGFTSTQALEQLSGIVGRDTVWAVLNSGLLASPPHPLSFSYGVASDLRQKQVKEMRFDTLTKSGVRAGTRIFIMPSNSELAAKLGIRDGSLSDPLRLEDLMSAKHTRMALHRALLRRRPGQYLVRWFANRLGVSERTVYRYHASDPLFRREIVCDAKEITWFNVETAMPDVAPHGGCFLLDGNGKKYPCKRPVAQKLLARKRKVTYMRRRPNLWSYGEREPDPGFFSELDTPLPVAAGDDRHPLYTLFPQNDSVQQAATPQNHSVKAPRAEPVMVGQDRPRTELAGMRILHYQPAVDPQRLEKMAFKLRNTINAMSSEEQRMSVASARRLLDTYGEKAVWRALRIVEKRNNVVKPVGLLSVILRSERRWKGHQP